jgi:hypothetical protein
LTIRNSKKTVDAALPDAASTAKIVILAMIAALIVACSPQQAPEPSIAPQAAARPDPAQQWLGKGVDAMEKDLGAPTEVITLEEDRGGGGKMFLYAKPGQPHMVFETAPGSQTIDKAETVE